MDKMFIAANSTHHSSSLLEVSQGGIEIMNLALGSVWVGLLCLTALILIQVGRDDIGKAGKQSDNCVLGRK